MTITIDPPISSYTINGNTYTNADWEANWQGALAGTAADIAAVASGFSAIGNITTASYDSRQIVTAPSTIGGTNSDADSSAARKLVYVDTEDLSGISTAAIRDTLFVSHTDEDETVYDNSSPFKYSTALRAFVSGPYSSSAFQTGYRSLYAVWAQAEGKSGGDEIGISGVNAQAIQWGDGIGSNLFAATNPSGAVQAASLAAGQFLVEGKVAAVDSTHLARGVVIENTGYEANAGLLIASGATSPYTGYFTLGIDMSSATISDATGGAGIYMPLSVSGSNSGGIIRYGSSDFFAYDRSLSQYTWVIGAETHMVVKTGMVSVGQDVTPTGSVLTIGAGDTAKSQIKFAASSADPTSPATGDLWCIGGALKFFDGTSTKTITMA